MKCTPYGDRAMLVKFSQVIDVEINQQVISLYEYLKNVSGVNYQIPAYCSLTIAFDPAVITVKDLIGKVEEHQFTKKTSSYHRKLNIPVCYDEKLAPDFDDVIKQTKLTREDIIDIHTKTNYRVYMMGFIPGFAYLGKLDQKLHCKRKPEPRRRVPAQSVGIAGWQTGIYPSEAPGGWQLIGKTPIKPFQYMEKDPFIFRSGDEVSFYSITLREFEKIEKQVSSGKFKVASMYA